MLFISFFKLAEQKALLAQLGKLCRQWFASDEKGDWRYLFILVDCLLLFEIGNAGQELDSAVGQRSRPSPLK